MEEVTIDDLQQLYLASTCRCDECTDDTCEGCNLWDVQHKVREILEQNGVDVSIN